MTFFPLFNVAGKSSPIFLESRFVFLLIVLLSFSHVSVLPPTQPILIRLVRRSQKEDLKVSLGDGNTQLVLEGKMVLKESADAADDKPPSSTTDQITGETGELNFPAFSLSLLDVILARHSRDPDSPLSPRLQLSPSPTIRNTSSSMKDPSDRSSIELSTSRRESSPVFLFATTRLRTHLRLRLLLPAVLWILNRSRPSLMREF